MPETVAVPTPVPVTLPFESTIAMFLLFVFHVTFLEVCRNLKVELLPTIIVVFETVKYGASTLTLHLYIFPFAFTDIIVEPLAFPETNPLLFTVATDLLLLDHFFVPVNPYVFIVYDVKKYIYKFLYLYDYNLL